MRWFSGLVVGCLLLTVAGCIKRVSSHIVVAGEVDDYLPGDGGTLTWLTYGTPFEISWLGPQPCLPVSSADGKMVSCKVPKTKTGNNAYGYVAGTRGETASIVPGGLHIMRVGPCTNCSAVARKGGYANPQGMGSNGNYLYCPSVNSAPTVLPLVIQASKLTEVDWTVFGANYVATLAFAGTSPCDQKSSLTNTNQPFCKVTENASGDYHYTVEAITQCSSGSPTQFTLHVN